MLAICFQISGCATQNNPAGILPGVAVGGLVGSTVGGLGALAAYNKRPLVAIPATLLFGAVGAGIGMLVGGTASAVSENKNNNAAPRSLMQTPAQSALAGAESGR